MRTLALLALILLAAPAHADTIYSYVSDAFRFVQGVYAPWDRITGNFVLAEAFVPQQQLGAGIEAAVTARLQRATAWAATALLRAIRIPSTHDGVYIDLPKVRVEACSGLQTLVLLFAASALIAAVLPARRLPWALALFVSAVVLALEANALRVAGIALGVEYAGPLSLATKDWIGVGTTGLALVQMAVLGRLVGLGRLLAR